MKSSEKTIRTIDNMQIGRYITFQYDESFRYYICTFPLSLDSLSHVQKQIMKGVLLMFRMYKKVGNTNICTGYTQLRMLTMDGTVCSSA